MKNNMSTSFVFEPFNAVLKEVIEASRKSSSIALEFQRTNDRIGCDNAVS